MSTNATDRPIAARASAVRRLFRHRFLQAMRDIVKAGIVTASVRAWRG